jgi:hypothetical protein
MYKDRYFPIYILDQNKNVIGTIKAFINGDENKKGYIPFRGILVFENPKTIGGYIIFGDNNSNTLKVSFKQRKMPTLLFSSYTSKVDECVVTGCRMQFCLDQSDAKSLVSSCGDLPQFACYRTAKCERNPDSGRCGWKMDNALASCLQNSSY